MGKLSAKTVFKNGSLLGATPPCFLIALTTMLLVVISTFAFEKPAAKQIKKRLIF
jgi:hypothetical protein